MSRGKLTRLLAVVAIITAVLVPAVAANAAVYVCDGNTYDATNPAHAIYGGGLGTTVTGSAMVVNLSAATQGMILFWNGTFASDTGTGVPTTHATISGSKYGDTICGTTGDDTIKGKKGSDRIFGGGSVSNYSALTGLGGDQLFGNAGNDFISNAGAAFGGFIKGAGGKDTIVAGANADLASGGNGNDSLIGGATGPGRLETLNGNNGNDTFTGGTAFSFFSGGKGDDTMTAGTGAGQWFSGDAGNDTISGLGAAAADQVGDGGAGDDTLSGSSSAASFPAWLFGGPGDDTLTAPFAGGWLFGDYGSEAAYAAVAVPGAPSAWNLATGPGAFWDVTAGSSFPRDGVSTGADSITGSQTAGAGGVTAYGGPGDDHIYGSSAGDFWLDGEVGNDWIEGRDGADSAPGGILQGGPGDDTMYGNTPSVLGTDLNDAAFDDMHGGTGNDKYYGSCTGPGAGDLAVEAAGEGSDYAKSTMPPNTNIETVVTEC